MRYSTKRLKVSACTIRALHRMFTIDTLRVKGQFTPTTYDGVIIDPPVRTENDDCAVFDGKYWHKIVPPSYKLIFFWEGE